MKSIDHFLEESDSILENTIIPTKKIQAQPVQTKLKTSPSGLRLVEQAIRGTRPMISKESIQEHSNAEPKKVLPKPIQREEKRIEKPAPVPMTESVQSEFDVGGVINELVGRIKDTETIINGLTENIKVLSKEKADRPKYSFTVKRDKDGKIESVLAAPTSEGN